MESYNFEKLKGKHFACVYRLVFPNGKIYVGKSKEIGKRMHLYERKLNGAWDDSAESSVLYDAIREYGLDSIVIDILFRANSASGVDWKKDLDYALGIVEMRWIKELGSSNPDVGYNATVGGEMFGVRELERVREVEKTRVVYNDIVVDRERRTNGVPVVGYDINGDFIGEWPSRVSFSRDVLNIKSTLDYGVWRKGYIMYEKGDGDYPKKVESYADYLVRTKSAEIEAKRVLESKIGRVKGKRDVRLSRGVVFVDATGTEHSRYDNIRDASDTTGIKYSSIYACLKRGYGHAGQFFVFWSDEWDSDSVACLRSMPEKKVSLKQKGKAEGEKRHRVSHGKVYQYDANFREIGVFESVREAADSCGYQPSIIYSALNRGINQFGGIYHWCYESDRIVKEEEAEAKVEANDAEKTQNTLFDGFSSEEW